MRHPVYLHIGTGEKNHASLPKDFPDAGESLFYVIVGRKSKKRKMRRDEKSRHRSCELETSTGNIFDDPAHTNYASIIAFFSYCVLSSFFTCVF